MLSVFLLQWPLYTFFGNGAGFGNSRPPERSHQIRRTWQLPPAARNLEHNASAAVRLFASTEIPPDESQTGINVRVFPALLQDRREVLTATSTAVIRTWSRV